MKANGQVWGVSSGDTNMKWPVLHGAEQSSPVHTAGEEVLCDGGLQVFEAWVTPGLAVTHVLARGWGQQAWRGHGLPGH